MQKKLKNKTKRKIAIAIIIIGIIVLICPYILEKITQNQMNDSINDFFEKTSQIKNEEKETETSNKNEKYLNELYQEMEKYNKNLYENGQNIVDAFSYQNTNFDLTKYNLTENIIGTISIPKINIQIPLYLGSTEENLNKGAAILGQTSMPLGQVNSNTVIAAHRGLITHQMFRNIDKLQIGDKVEITTFWDTLNYEVSEIEIINPSDISKVLIQKGKDMITLVTCHPYRINTQRYIVYCKRK